VAAGRPAGRRAAAARAQPNTLGPNVCARCVFSDVMSKVQEEYDEEFEAAAPGVRCCA
jgi:hypothetical protein